MPRSRIRKGVVRGKAVWQIAAKARALKKANAIRHGIELAKKEVAVRAAARSA